ncbi:protein NOI4-like isoform X2 [Mercurialis annua]|uniref:protein NOI4-like isoform X2 n=1 Tax=Mercurialis annua TaxID=3986 RepID=UPI0024AE7ED1|nr:protein NOI4-like isoform X2 [Mercurialis annua]
MLWNYENFFRKDKGRPLPKFGEWDVNNPASAEGFTVIFSKARDEKKSNAAGGAGATSQRNNHLHKPDDNNYQDPNPKWFCCF